MPIDPIPPLDRTSPTFRADADYYFSTRQPNFSTQAEAARLEILAKAASTAADAATASTKAGIATTKAGEAAISASAAQGAADDAATQATAVATASKISLGSKAADPATDNQGGALLPGAWYYNNIAPGKIRVYTGAGWVEGIASVAGVTSVNGAAGAVVNIATTGANIFTGNQTLNGNKITAPLLQHTLELRATAAIAAGALALDLANAITSVPLNANVTSITFANNLASATACQSHTLELTGDGTQRTVIWPAGNGTTTLLVKWPGGVAPPAPTLTSGKVCTYSFKSRTQFLWDAFEAGTNQ